MIRVHCPQCGAELAVVPLVSTVTLGPRETTVEFLPAAVEHACPDPGA